MAEFDNSTVGEDDHFSLRHIWEAITDWQVWLLGLLNMAVIMPGACYFKNRVTFDSRVAAVDGISYFLPCVDFVLSFDPHADVDE